MPIDKATIEALNKHLFPDHQENNTYAVLDAAAVPNLELPKLLWRHRPENVCLYRGELAPDLAATAPYLIKLEKDHPFTELLLKDGWGNHWGIFAITPKASDLKTMRLHFRKFLMVTSPENKPLYFRYYDPRVLRVYLPTCNKEELNIVFGSILSFMLEDENPGTLLAFSPKDNGKFLQTQKIRVSQ